MKPKRVGVYISIILWMIMFSLQGAGILGNTIEPKIGSLPFSVFYLFIMGLWGVINVFAIVDVTLPDFYKKVKELGLLEEKKETKSRGEN